MASHPENRLLTGKLLVMAVAMFGFGFALIPLYDVFCDITGLNGKTSDSAQVVSEAPDTGRLVTVEFTGTVNQAGPWEFRPQTVRMQVHPGKLYSTTFFARNLEQRPKASHATPSVAPGKYANYLRKTECFCFNRQDFEGGEGRDMPLRFVVDPALPDYVTTLTLSYTLFDLTELAAAGSVASQ